MTIIKKIEPDGYVYGITAELRTYEINSQQLYSFLILKDNNPLLASGGFTSEESALFALKQSMVEYL